MAQVQNLLDMILNRVHPQSKSDKAATAKAFADATKSAKSGLLPLDNSPAPNPSMPKPETFHAKVEASRAKYYPKESRPETPQVNAPTRESNPGSRPIKSKPPESSEVASQNNDRAQQAAGESADRTKRANRHSRSGHKPANLAADPNASRNLPITSESRVNDPGQPSSAPEADQAAAQPVPDGQAETALKDRLDKMGIHASDDQLRDPAFLTRLLQFLQSSGAASESNPPASGLPDKSATLTSTPSEAMGRESNPPVIGPDQISTGPNSIQAQADVEAAAKNQTPVSQLSDANQAQANSTGNPTANPAEKNLADLIKDRLGELARQQAGPTENQSNPVPGVKSDAGSNAAAPVPEMWRGVRVAANQDMAPVEALPMADLDKLRVIQAAALQNLRNADAPTLRLAEDHDSQIDAVHGSANARETQVSGQAKNSGADSDTQTDLFGGKQEAQNAQAATGKDGSQVVKEGNANAVFGQSLEQARNIDHKTEIASPRPATPAHAPFEAGVLDQISKKMTAAGIKGGDTINIQLEPEHLGKVRVSLEMKEGGTMTARINVENENVRQIVDANLANLRDSLENQGIKLQGLEVSVDQQHSSLFNPDGSNSESFFQRQGRGGVTRNPNDTSADAIDPSPESETGRRWGYNTMEYIA